MGILRTDRVSGLGGANAIKGSVNFTGSRYAETYFDIDASTDFAFGTGDFTIECWINLTHDDADNYYKRVYMTDGPTGNASGNFQIAIVPSTGVVNLWESGSALDVSGSTKVTKVGWVHIAAVRSGSGSNNLKLYVDGVQDLQTTYTTSISPNSGNPRPRIGAYAKDTGGSLPGHVSNLRVSNEALYTSAFTRPTTELEKLSSTILLCFQSPGNIIKEETDKILVPNRVKITSNFPTASRFTPNSPVGFSTTTDVGTQFGSTFDGVTTFDSQAYMVPPGGNTRERNRGRGVLGGGAPFVSPNVINNMSYVEIQSGGIFKDFGDLTVARGYFPAGQTSSSTRGLSSAGWTGSSNNTIDFITIANTANAIDFGDTSIARMSGALSNQTRAVHAGTTSPFSNVIDFVTIATTGDAQNFGDLVEPQSLFAGASSSTRGVFGGGRNNTPSSNTLHNTMQFITIATTGDTQDFGDLQALRYGHTGFSSPTRGIFAGGYLTPGQTASIDFFTIATLGNSLDFGDLGTANGYCGSVTNSIRGAVTINDAPNYTNALEFITIATKGDAKDFGDADPLGSGKGHGDYPSCMSDSHGGL